MQPRTPIAFCQWQSPFGRVKADENLESWHTFEVLGAASGKINGLEGNCENFIFATRVGHGNAYLPWGDAADKLLCRMYDEGESIDVLSEIFERTKGAIRSRLNKLGRLE